MKPPILIGIALAIVIIAVAALIPWMLTTPAQTAAKAQATAVLAGRELARVSAVLPRVGELATTTAPADAVQQALAAAGETLKQVRDQLTQDAQHGKQVAREHRMPEPSLALLPPDAAVKAFAQGVKDNAALLQQADKDARAAAQQDGTALGVQQAVGMTAYARALELLAEAQRARSDEEVAEAALLAEAADWKLAQGQYDHYKALDIVPIQNGLKTDLDEIAKTRAEAHTTLDGLTAQVAEREQSLGQVEQELAAANAELGALRDKGFAASDDSAFAAYRQKYLELSLKVRDLQSREQELRDGGLRGAKLEGDDLMAAKMEGGEPVASLQALRNQLAVAQERARRLDNANQSLDAHLKFVADSGQRSKEEMQRFQERMSESVVKQQEIAKRIDATETAARAKEEQALGAAREATRAFGQAQQAADRWLTQVREARERDPQQKNQRLALILDDPYFEQVARSAEAAARLLEGRIYAQRSEGSDALINTMRMFGEVNTGAELTFNPEPVNNALTTARSEGKQTLTTAAEIYDKMATRLASRRTDWLPLTGKAAALYLLGRIEPDKLADHQKSANEALQKALEKREQSPYLQPLATVRDVLSGAPGAAESKPAEAETEKAVAPTKEPAEKAKEAPEKAKEAPEQEKPKKEGDFFGE